MWQGLQTITDYNRKTSHVADTDGLLPDKLNKFFARFEDNTVHRRGQLPRTIRSPSPWWTLLSPHA
ncbi:hypothetical protein J4Q44_G00154590 [Coregonus suidteri]|uniref:Uncharacterized protein n=1 Tax=Coregonus suidteri TaxID=861788 RepID=A0AAN8QS01_9TELE